MIRKINGVFALLSSLVLISHIVITATSSLKGVHGAIPTPVIAVTVIVIGVHAILSLYITLSSAKDGSGTGKYPKVHGKTIAQRVTGILCIILAVAHIYINSNIMGVPWVKAADFAIIAIALFALSHMSISFAKAFVSLGIITKEKTVHIMEIIGHILSIMLAAYAIYMAVSSLTALPW